MEEKPRIMLADYLQAAEIETHIDVQEEDSVRPDWWRASCGLHDWYTTGSRPNVEDAAAHHVAWDHLACATVDPDSPADALVYCRMLPGHSDDHANGGRCWPRKATTPGSASMTDAPARNASHYFATSNDRNAFLEMFGEDQLDTLFTPEFAHYMRHGLYPTTEPAGKDTPLTAAGIAAIRRRNRDLADIPFNTHDGRVHGDNCPPCNLVRGIEDVSRLLEQLDYLSAPATVPFAMQQPEYEAENQRLWERAAEADRARVQAELRAAKLRLVLGSALRSFTKRGRRGHNILRSRWVKAAKVEQWQRVYKETGFKTEPAPANAQNPENAEPRRTQTKETDRG